VSKLLFVPVSALGGLLAGVIGRRMFQRLWSLLDEREPPAPSQSDAPWSKLLAALLLEGAIFRVVRGIVDRGSRQAFKRVTGAWPGEKPPE